ncbi:MAG: YggS family pyridoxal phosphate-dependent enzyme [Chitinophagaceae bacterium]|nr:MAG: YggS family pyridoxal phosphate-dependent enzyme [Chitinophagaceae bacterium]
MPELENLKKLVKETQEKKIKLVAVSKTKSEEEIMEVYKTGHLHFGENKAIELKNKAEKLPKDIEWHFIGNLQSNKVKFVVPHVSWIHSIDRPKIIKAINKEAQKADKKIKVLLQIYIADEESKIGFSMEELKNWLKGGDYQNLKNVEICGVMGMATFTDDTHQIKQEFSLLKEYFDQLKAGYFSDNQNFKEISMGMTGDYKIAVECGSTMLRIGSLIFGERN